MKSSFYSFYTYKHINMSKLTAEQRQAIAHKAAITKRKNKQLAEREKRAEQRKEKDRLKKQASRAKERNRQLREWETKADDLKELFFQSLQQSNGHLGMALKSCALPREWYQRMVVQDLDFHSQMLSYLEDTEDDVQSKLYELAKSGNTFAADAYFKRITLHKARIEYKHRIATLQTTEVSLEKSTALKFAITELLTTYYELKANGKQNQAIYALKQYIELLELKQVSDVGEYDILTGRELTKIMDALGIKPNTIQDINFEEVSEDMKEHYLEMFPQKKLEVNGNNKQ